MATLELDKDELRAIQLALNLSNETAVNTLNIKGLEVKGFDNFITQRSAMKKIEAAIGLWSDE